VRDERVLRLQVEHVVLVDARGDDHQRTLGHLGRARRVLNELDQLVLEHDRAGGDGEVASDLERRFVTLADAAALCIGDELREPSRQALAVRFERLVERLRVGGRKVRRAHGVDPLPQREARTLLCARLEGGGFERLRQVARREEIGLLEIVVVRVAAPGDVSEAPVAGLRRGHDFLAPCGERAPQAHLLLEIRLLQGRAGVQPRTVDRRSAHQAHPALRELIGGLRDGGQDGVRGPRVHARGDFATHKRRRQMILSF